MLADPVVRTLRRSQGRSAVSNGTHLLEGVDHRSASARRFRDLAKAFAADLGGLNALSEGEKALVRQAAACAIRAEQVQACLVRGELVDPDELIRLTNTARRTLQSIRKRAPHAPEGDGLTSLRSYAAAVRGADL